VERKTHVDFTEGESLMQKWLVEHFQDIREEPRFVKRNLPAEGVVAQSIQKEVSTVGLNNLSSVDQYIIALKYCFGRAYCRFDAIDFNEVITRQLDRIRGYTSDGKVWVVNNTTVALLTMDVTSDAKNAYRELLLTGSKGGIVPQLLSSVSKWAESPSMRFVVNKNEVPYLPMDDGLEEICHFFRQTQLGNGLEFTLSVSGWDISHMETPNDVIRMLTHRFKRVTLYAEPVTRRVCFISMH
jgi:hypothetical protein